MILAIYLYMITRLWERLEEIKRERKNPEQFQAFEHALDLYYFLLDNYEMIKQANKLESFEKQINVYLYKMEY